MKQQGQQPCSSALLLSLYIRHLANDKHSWLSHEKTRATLCITPIAQCSHYLYAQEVYCLAQLTCVQVHSLSSFSDNFLIISPKKFLKTAKH